MTVILIVNLTAGVIIDFIKLKENISTSVTDKTNVSFLIDHTMYKLISFTLSLSLFNILMELCSL